MPSYSHGPVLARKRLATALRDLREAGSFTLDHVASRLMVSTSKLSRLEKAQGLPQLRDVRDLVDLYGLADTPDGDRLMRWAREGRRKGWWTDYDDVLGSEEYEFIGYENDATVSLGYSFPFIHGLLQTESYCRSLLTNLQPTWSAREVERKVQTRLTRQQNLLARGDGDPLELKIILYESCLHQSVGSVDVLREQLDFLQNSMKASNIDIRILPMSAPPHTAMISEWQHFSFGEEVDRDVVFLETSAGLKYIEDDGVVRRYERWHAELTRRSLDPAMSVDKIRAALSDL